MKSQGFTSQNTRNETVRKWLFLFPLISGTLLVILGKIRENNVVGAIGYYGLFIATIFFVFLIVPAIVGGKSFGAQGL